MGRIRNQEIANFFYEIADILEIQGVAFKPIAYRRAARTIETIVENIEDLHKQNKLREIPGVGENIAKKIEEILLTGDLGYLEQLRNEIPPGLSELMKIQGVGPKTIQRLHDKLGINNLTDLEQAVKKGRIKRLKGFGEKTEKKIHRGIEILKQGMSRFLLGDVLPIAQEIEQKLRQMSEVDNVQVAGSVRRWNETVGDVDILASSNTPHHVMEVFTHLPDIESVLARGETKSTIVLRNRLQVDLRIVQPTSFGAALQYFTGSKGHNIHLREMAVKNNWKLNEYGLFENETNRQLAGKTEEEIYTKLGLDYIEPELREDRGELKAAVDHTLPHLLTRKDIKGDLHVHSKWSDGEYSIEEMAKAAQSLGHQYMALCDHSQTLKVAGGLSEEEAFKQFEEIDRLNRQFERKFTILAGAEVDIDADGHLGASQKVLEEYDFVVASIHSGFEQPERKITERVLSAIHSGYVSTLGHPTGRLVNKRDPYHIDLPKIFQAAAATNVCMEIDAFPSRWDLSDIYCQEAKKAGVKFTIGSDAHSTSHLHYIDFGVAIARRGWLEKTDIINTMDIQELKRYLGIEVILV